MDEDLEISFADDGDENDDPFHQTVDQEDLEADLEDVDISFVSEDQVGDDDDNEEEEELDESIGEAEWHGAFIEEGDRIDVFNVISHYQRI